MMRKLLLVLLISAGLVLAGDESSSEGAKDAAKDQGKSQKAAAAKQDEARKDESGKEKEESPENAAEDGKEQIEGKKTEADGAEAGTGEAKETAEEEAPAAQSGPKLISGMSILGNQEAPKSLVIVPWKTSELGDSLGIAPLLDDSRQPVDREVFLRSLSYYQIRSGKKP